MANDGGEISLEACLRPLTPLQTDQAIALTLRQSDVHALLRDTLARCARSRPSLVSVKVYDTIVQLDADLDAPPPQRIEVASYP
jgi:hypothetical protein